MHSPCLTAMEVRKHLKNKLKKVTVIIITFLIVIAFSLNIVDTAAYARGGGSTKSSSGTSRSTPSSGAKSGSFSNTKPSSSQTTKPSTSSSKSSVSGGSSWHMPTIIFWPHRTLYYDSYGGSHYGYGRPSLLSGLMDIIIFLGIIGFILWIIKRRR